MDDTYSHAQRLTCVCVFKNAQDKIIKKLLTKGANVNLNLTNIIKKKGALPRTKAFTDMCMFKYTQDKIIKKLLTKGANVNLTDKEGHTPAHFAKTTPFK